MEGLEGLEGFGGCLERLESFGGFGVFAGWQTAALKANRKPLLWPWPWGAWLRSGLGPGVPVGEGVWRVWRVLEGLEGFGLEGFRGFGRFGGFWRVFGGFGRFWRVWRVWRVLEGVWRVWRILERLEGFGGFGVFAGWQTAALKANRRPLLWPWPWGACWGSGLGPGVPAGQGVWRVWTVLEGFGGGPTGQVPHLRWSQAPPRPWRRPGSADFFFGR